MVLSHKVNNMPEQTQHVQFGLLRGNIGSKTEDGGGANHRQLPRTPDEMNMLKFPVTKNSLWDNTSTGQPVHLSISYFRKPKLFILEKVLRFAQRHAESTGQSVYNCALLGSLEIAEDGEGVTLVLDRFDPGGVTSSSKDSITPGDVIVPFMISGHSKNERFSSLEDYVNALMVLKDKCCGKEPVHCCNYILAKGWCNFYNNGDKCVHHLDFDVLTLATEFNATPISPVPIVPTALSKNLSGPMSLSHLQGEPKSGYLTMDHTRKVLLVLESDPKAYTLPLVGIWLSGVPFIYSPFVWAACLRFIYNSSIHDRVCVPPESFLLVLYNPMHSKPEFYEVNTSTGSSKMNFDLLSGYEAVGLSKTMSSGPQDSVEMDLTCVDKGSKKEMFDGALHSLQSQLHSPVRDGSSPSRTPTSDDITPRCKPAPHTSKLPTVMPMVPEVSLLFGDDGQSGILVDKGPRRPAITQGRPNRVTNLSDYPGSHSSPTNIPASQNSVPFTSHSRPPRMTHHSQSAPNLLQTQQNQCSTNSQQPIQCTYGATRQVVHSNPLPQQYMENVNPPRSVNSNRPFFSAQQGNIIYENGSDSGRNMVNVVHGNVQFGRSNSVPVYNGTGQANLPPGQDQFPHLQTGQMVSPHGYQSLPLNQNSIAQQRFQQPVQPRPRYNGYAYPSQQTGVNTNRMPSQGNAFVRQTMTFNTPMSQQGAFYSQPQPQSHTSHQRLAANQNYDPYTMQNGIPRPVLPVHSAVENPQQIQTSVGNNVVMSSNMPRMGHSQGAFMLSMPGTLNQQMPLPVTHPESTSGANNQTQKQQRPINHADSSGRSSDDSGLSVTPERPSLPPKNTDDVASSSDPKQLGVQSSKINWNQVPPEVYQLLLSQDAQLKQLQAQIQLLMHNQSTSTQYTTTTELGSQPDTSGPASKQNISEDSTSVNPKVETCSVAVNTTLFYPPPQSNNEMHTVALQTSPQKAGTLLRQPIERLASGNNTPSEGSQCSVEGRTPAEIRHRGVFALNSTERDDFDVDVSNSDLSGVVNNMALHEKTIDSVQSELIVDLPSYHSSPTRSRTSQDTGSGSMGLSTSSRSPISASMCEQQQYGDCSDTESEDDGGEDDTQGEQLSADNKEYYDKLMNNIHQLLNQHNSEDTGLAGMEDSTQNPTLPSDTLQQSIMLGQYLNSLQRLENTGNPMETTFIPKINYMSMMLDSDSDTSMEINAMAMKYLKDEQLTKLTKLQAHGAVKGTKETLRLAALRQILSEERNEGTPNVTSMGMSPNDLTFATRKYMEKHGLLNDSKNIRRNSADDVLSDDSYQLKMNYSSNSSNLNSTAQVTQEVLKTPSSARIRNSIQNTPDSCKDGKNVQCSGNILASRGVNSPSVAKPTNSPFVNSYNNSGNAKLPNPQFTQTPKNTPTRHLPQQQGHNYSLERQNNSQTPTRTNMNHNPLSTPQQQRLHHCVEHDKINTPKQNTPNNRGRVISPIAQDPPIQRHIETGPVKQGNVRQTSPAMNGGWEDADKILDITHLKQLPKLL